MIGTKLAHYEITAHLGSGGMGDVYLATDLKLKRSVAVKLLPAEFASDSERLTRFRREAQLLAALNHPNIAHVYGLEESGDKQCIVMELVEGETLQARLKRGPIAVNEALAIAKQICEGLEAAHEKGVIHRDLKPGNVMLASDGKVKVLDFGLAKAFEQDTSNENLSNSPTMMSGGSMQGVILGTAAYMSPEQARGRKVDQRTDIFAFGCLLYEMLTGKRTFDGEDVSEILARVLTGEPDWLLLPATVYPRIRELLHLCLEKNAKNRRTGATDVRLDIEQALKVADGSILPATSVKRPLWKRALPAAITGVVVAVIAGGLAWGLRPAPVATAVTRFSFTLPKDQSFTRTGRHIVALSADGANIVYVANQQLYLKPMAATEATAIPGTKQDINTPLFSPDSRWVAFFAASDKKLKKIAITGGASVTIADSATPPFGATWYSADQILVGRGSDGIERVSANGGKPERVIAVKTDELAQSPHVLPDGDNVLFTLATVGDDRWDKAQIVVQSLKSGQRKVLIEGGSDARYVPTGHIVYALGTTLFAVPFDAKELQVTGGPIPIVEDLSRSGPTQSGATFYAFSDNGSLISVTGGILGGATSARTLALVSRSGDKKPIGISPMPYFGPRISPDGKHLAVEVNDGLNGNVNIWIYELSGSTSIRRLTFTGKNRNPIWTPDSQRVVFTSDREGDNGLFWQRADGSGVAERLTTAEKGPMYHYAESWSPDGKRLTFYNGLTGGFSGTVWILTLDGDRKPTPLIEVPPHSANNSNFSPDGHWIAYQSNESGKYEVWVQPFPATGAKYQISSGGGTFPRWSTDGKRLFYLPFDTGGRNRIAAIDIRTQPTFAFGKPELLPVEGFTFVGGEQAYDPMPDGKQFLVMLPPSETASGDRPPLQINVVLNWFSELNQRVPLR